MARIDEWLQEDKLILLEGWAKDGLTEEQIAKNMGISRPTLWDWKKKEVNIFNAIKKGRGVADYEIENALFKSAIGYTIVLNEEKVTKDGDVVNTKRDVHFPPNVTAQIFWLKNRKSKQWRDKVDDYATSNELTKVDELLAKINEEAKK